MGQRRACGCSMAEIKPTCRQSTPVSELPKGLDHRVTLRNLCTIHNSEIVSQQKQKRKRKENHHREIKRVDSKAYLSFRNFVVRVHSSIMTGPFTPPESTAGNTSQNSTAISNQKWNSLVDFTSTITSSGSS